jgi:hypothetical protein
MPIELEGNESTKAVERFQSDKHNKALQGLRNPHIGRLLMNSLTLNFYKPSGDNPPPMEWSWKRERNIPKPEDAARQIGELFMAVLAMIEDKDVKREVWEDVVGITARRKELELLAEAEMEIADIEHGLRDIEAWEAELGKLHLAETEGDSGATEGILRHRQAVVIMRLLAEVQQVNMAKAMRLAFGRLMPASSEKQRLSVLLIVVAHWERGQELADAVGLRRKGDGE